MCEIHHNICKKFRLGSLTQVYIMLYNLSFGRYSHFKVLVILNYPTLGITKSQLSLCGIDFGTTVHRTYLLREINAYFYDYLIDLNDILLMAYYNRPMCCQIAGILDIS